MSYALIAAASSAAKDRARAWPSSSTLAAEPVSDPSRRPNHQKVQGVSPGHGNSNRSGSSHIGATVPRPSPRPSRLTSRLAPSSTPATPSRCTPRPGVADTAAASLGSAATTARAPPVVGAAGQHESSLASAATGSRRAVSTPCVRSTNRALRSPGRGAPRALGASIGSACSSTPGTHATSSAVAVTAPQITVSLVGHGKGRLGFKGGGAAGVAAQVVEAFAERISAGVCGEVDGGRRSGILGDQELHEEAHHMNAELGAANQHPGHSSELAARDTKANPSDLEGRVTPVPDRYERSTSQSSFMGRVVGTLARPTEPLEVARQPPLPSPRFSSTHLGVGRSPRDFEDGFAAGKDFTFALENSSLAREASRGEEAQRDDGPGQESSAWQELESSLKDELLRDLLPEILAAVSKRDGEMHRIMEQNDEKLADELSNKIRELNVKLGANMQALEDKLTESIRHVAHVAEQAARQSAEAPPSPGKDAILLGLLSEDGPCLQRIEKVAQEAVDASLAGFLQEQQQRVDELARDNAGLITVTKEAIGDLRRDVVDVLGQNRETCLTNLEGEVAGLSCSFRTLESNFEVLKVRMDDKSHADESTFAKFEEMLAKQTLFVEEKLEEQKEQEVTRASDEAKSLEDLSRRLDMLSARLEAVVAGEETWEERFADLETMVAGVQAHSVPEAAMREEDLIQDREELERPTSTKSSSTIPPIVEAYSSPQPEDGSELRQASHTTGELDELNKKMEAESARLQESVTQFEAILTKLGEEVDHNSVGLRSCLDRLEVVEKSTTRLDERWAEQEVSAKVAKEVAAQVESVRSQGETGNKSLELRLATMEATLQEALDRQHGQLQCCIERLEKEPLDEEVVRSLVLQEWVGRFRPEVIETARVLVAEQLDRPLQATERLSRMEEESRTRLDRLQDQLEELRDDLSQTQRELDVPHEEEGKPCSSEPPGALADDIVTSDAFLAEVANARGAADAAMTMVEHRSEELADSLEATEVALRRDFKKDLLSLREELESKFTEADEKLQIELSSKKGQFLANKAQLEELESTLEAVRRHAATELRAAVAQLQGDMAEVQQECRGWVDTALQKLEDIAVRTRERLGEFSTQIGGMKESLGQDFQSMLSAVIQPLASRLNNLAATQNRRRQLLSEAARAASASSSPSSEEGSPSQQTHSPQDLPSDQLEEAERPSEIRPAPPAKPQPPLRRVPSFSRITRQRPAQSVESADHSQFPFQRATTPVTSKVQLVPVAAGLLAACASDPAKPRGGTYTIPGSIRPRRRTALTGHAAVLQRSIEDVDDTNDDCGSEHDNCIAEGGEGARSRCDDYLREEAEIDEDIEIEEGTEELSRSEQDDNSMDDSHGPSSGRVRNLLEAAVIASSRPEGRMQQALEEREMAAEALGCQEAPIIEPSMPISAR